VSKLRWYIDADTLGLAKILVQVRQDITFPGDDGRRPHHKRDVEPCLITDTSTKDPVWIPQVARAGLAIITRDRRIQDRVGEKDMVVASNARMFAMTSPEPLDKWGQLEVVVSQWRAMERAADEPGPYIYSLTRTALKKIDI
jgi:PIN domain-containing protein